MDDATDRAMTYRRSPAVALVLMAAIPFERRAGGAPRPRTPATTSGPKTIQHSVTRRRGGFGQLGDAVSLDDRA